MPAEAFRDILVSISRSSLSNSGDRYLHSTQQHQQDIHIEIVETFATQLTVTRMAYTYAQPIF
jgi:hypothetical protein